MLLTMLGRVAIPSCAYLHLLVCIFEKACYPVYFLSTSKEILQSGLICDNMDLLQYHYHKSLRLLVQGEAPATAPFCVPFRVFGSVLTNFSRLYAITLLHLCQEKNEK